MEAARKEVQDLSGRAATPRRYAGGVAALVLGAASSVASAWCLGMGGIGPVRAGMTVEEVLRLADWPGLERRQPAGACWYLPYRGGKGQEFDLMIIDGRVARIEIRRASRLTTFSGARIGSSEDELKQLYGPGLDIQPHKYEPDGRTLTLRSGDGGHGLRFETLKGRVTAIQGGPWEHLNYVEGCG
jgi:hypothetical protein